MSTGPQKKMQSRTLGLEEIPPKYRTGQLDESSKLLNHF